jgi:Carboxypeptidase regulatory-like domain/TonB dependent receptor-like, beta-barrel/TonB-dependent Receptor Plug Domain
MGYRGVGVQRLSIVIIIALVSFSIGGVAVAQDTTGTITGRIVDAQALVLPGVTVTATGSQGAKTTVTDGEGRFTFAFLTPGAYAIHAELQGFTPVERANVQVHLGQAVDLPLTMQISALAETVVVTSTTPQVDTTSASIGANLDSDTLSRLPIGRRFSDTLYLTPGVSTGGNVGAANPSIEGSSGLENQYVVDGVNITNGGYGALGSYSIVFGSLGNGTPYDFMQEVQVKTGGYEAEFGQTTGGVINVVTKSGSNAFKGSAFGYARPSSLESAYNTVQSVEGTVNTVASRLSDVGAAVGGPIRRNRLFFFGAIDPQWQTNTFAAPNGFPLQTLGNVDRDRRILNYAAKASWQATPSHRFDASFFGDPATGAMGPQRSSALLKEETSGYSSLDFGGHNQAVHYDGVLNAHFLVDASFGRALNRILETPSVNDWQVTDFRVSPRTITGGVGFYEAGNRSDSWQVQAKATNILAGLGQHQVRYGFDYEHLDFSQLQQYTGPTFTAPNGQQTATGATIDIIPDPVFDQIYHVSRASLTAARTTRQKYSAIFAEDEWKVGNSLTIRPGVRYEQETLAGTIVQNFSLKNNWAPRLGVVWDPTRRGQSKIFANYGRYYARVPNDLAARALSSDASITADYFDQNLTRPVPDGTVTTNLLNGNVATRHFTLLGGNADDIDGNAKLSYYNEWVAGTEYTLPQALAIGVRYVHRDIGRVLEDVQPYPIVASSLGLPGAATADYLLTNPGPGTPVVQDIPGATIAFESPVHDYNAVEFSATKRLGHNWSLISSYRWSRLTGNFEGFFRNDNGQSDPGISSLYDYPTNDPTYAAIGTPVFGYAGDIRFLGTAGPLPLDRTHDVKAYGTYAFGMGLNLSVGLELESGAPLTALAAHPVYDSGGEIPLTVRGAGFQTSNGFQTRTPWTKPVNAGASYNLKIGRRNLVAIADVFNVFNTQTILDYDSFSELQFGVPNRDFGAAGVSGVVSGQQFVTPRQVRVGVRYEF